MPKIEKYSPNKKKNCYNLFSPSMSFDAYSWRGITNESSSYGVDSIELNGLSKAKEITHKIIRRWVRERNYSKEETDHLLKINDSLDPMRTNFFSYEDSKGHFNAIRLFDGSTVPLQYGNRWNAVSKQTAKLPFEDDLILQGYRFPERILEEKTGENQYLLTIGSLNVDRFYEHGFDNLLRHISHLYIDRNYNSMQYQLKKSLSLIDKVNPTVYLICSGLHVKLYEKYGFQTVHHHNSEKKVTTSEQLYLMKATAKDILINYFPKPIAPSKRGSTTNWDENTYMQQVGQMRGYFDGLKKRKHDFSNQDNHIIEKFKLSSKLLLIKETEKLFEDGPMGGLLNAFGLKDTIQSQFSQSVYKEFFENLYVFMVSAYNELPIQTKNELNIDQALIFYELLLVMVNNSSHESAMEAFEYSNQMKPSLKLWDKYELSDALRQYSHILGNLDGNH
ncbi:MAG: hypothetical protein HOO06_11155 [Bdellovibrionaceae bacterium]|nr:hypothetical protein [Pseudobdellovibrionaceae bacterium]